MDSVTEGTMLWQPSETVKERTNVRQHMAWLEKERGLVFGSYPEIWEWSVADLDAVWDNIWLCFDVAALKAYARVLGDQSMPGADWFPGTELNYPQHISAT